MGQTYTVEAKLNFKDNDSHPYCSTIKREIYERDGVSAEFNLEAGDLNTVDGCLKILTSEDGFYDMDGIWCADFDGSYGWEFVMLRIFETAAKTLDDKSEIVIYPDSGYHKIMVKNGKVIIRESD